MNNQYLQNIFCNFKLIDTNNISDTYICNNCDYKLVVDNGSELPYIPCRRYIIETNINRKITRNIPIYKKIKNFAYALIKHIMGGAKRTTMSERQKRLEICKSCEFFDGYACQQCGCPITQQAKFISKLDWANQHCPINKW